MPSQLPPITSAPEALRRPGAALTLHRLPSLWSSSWLIWSPLRTCRRSPRPRGAFFCLPSRGFSYSSEKMPLLTAAFRLFPQKFNAPESGIHLYTPAPVPVPTTCTHVPTTKEHPYERPFIVCMCNYLGELKKIAEPGVEPGLAAKETAELPLLHSAVSPDRSRGRKESK